MLICESIRLKSAVSCTPREPLGWSCGMQGPSIHISSISLPAGDVRKRLIALSCSPSGSGSFGCIHRCETESARPTCVPLTTSPHVIVISTIASGCFARISW